MSHALRVGASLALSAVFLWIAARGVEWDAAWMALRDARLAYVPLLILPGAISLWFRAYRWGVLLRPVARVGGRSLFSATSIGFAANMLLPLRAGEVLKPWVLANREGLRFSQVVATVAVERLFDMATLLLLFGIATLTLPLPPEWRRYGWFFLATFAAFLAALFVLRSRPDRALRAVRRVLKPLGSGIADRVVHATEGFAHGLESLANGRVIAEAAAASLGVWGFIGLSFGFGFPALDLDVPFARGALTATTFVAIAVSIPGGPGFIGMFQVGCVVALAVFGVSKSPAFSYSVLVHLAQFATTVFLGLYFFAREGFRVDELRRVTGSPGSAAIERDD